MSRELRMMVYPRDRNPYQRLLYEELGALGVRHRYLGELTGSHTLNLALLAPQIALLRLAGFRYLHLHWVFRFTLPGKARLPALRTMMRWYLVFLLDLCRVLGIEVIWTAHNVLPHDRVFDDDVRGRQQLTERCSAVITHNVATLSELVGLECRLPLVAVIPPGPPEPLLVVPSQSKARDAGTIEVVFVGKVARYKGVEDLLEAMISLGDELAISLVVAGECSDLALFERLHELSASCAVPIEIHARFLSEGELGELLAEADVAVLPYRQVTSSSSVVMVLGAGLPVVIPDLASLAEIPESCAWRYDGSVPGLAAALREVVSTPPARRHAMADSGLAYAKEQSWERAALATLAVLHDSKNARQRRTRIERRRRARSVPARR